MNPSTSASPQNQASSRLDWENRQDELPSILTMALSHKKIGFYKSQEGLCEELQALREQKQKLTRYIVEYKKAEKSTREERKVFRKRMTQLHVSDTRSNDSIRKADYNLNVWQDMIRPVHIYYPPTPVRRLTVNLVNIDPNGSIINNGGSVKIKISEKCVLCTINDIDCFYKDCSHRCCCVSCTDQMDEQNRRCPLCHEQIRNAVQLYTVPN